MRRTVGPADFADDLNSWQGGALGPAHTLRQSAFLRGSNRSRRVDGLYYAGGSSVPLLIPHEEFAPLMRDGFFLVPRLATHEDQGDRAP